MKTQTGIQEETRVKTQTRIREETRVRTQMRIREEMRVKFPMTALRTDRYLCRIKTGWSLQ